MFSKNFQLTPYGKEVIDNGKFLAEDDLPNEDRKLLIADVKISFLTYLME